MPTAARPKRARRTGVLDFSRFWGVGAPDTEIVVTGRGSVEVDPRELIRSKQVQAVLRTIREADSRRDGSPDPTKD